jgi:hypothetical protein
MNELEKLQKNLEILEDLVNRLSFLIREISYRTNTDTSGHQKALPQKENLKFLHPLELAKDPSRTP